MSTKEEILDYVMNSPGNTNRAVLDSLLSNLEGGSSGVNSNILVIPISYNETTGEYTTTVTCGELKAIFNSRGAAMFTNISYVKDADDKINELIVAVHTSQGSVHPAIIGAEFEGTLLVSTDPTLTASYCACNFTGTYDNPQPLNDSDPLYVYPTEG